MSEESHKTEVRRTRKALRETVKLAKDASLTGALEGGARSSARSYNSYVQRLESLGVLPAGLFPSLGEEASFDEVGVAAQQLFSYLEDDEADEGEAPRIGSNNVFIGLSGLSGLKAFRDLRDFGQQIREHLPEWLEGRVGGKKDEGRPASTSEAQNRVAEVGAKLQQISEQLRREDLSDEQRLELSDELLKLGQEQARLVREHTSLRDKEKREKEKQEAAAAEKPG